MAKEWHFVVPIQPMATPRPSFRYDQKNNRAVTYYDDRYMGYMAEVQKLLKEQDLLNDQFYEIMASELGVRAEVYFYLKVPKGQKKINNIMRTSAPDIDNLLKAILDSIFKGLSIKDSRIVMVQTAKFQVLDNPRTEITLRSVDDGN